MTDQESALTLRKSNFLSATEPDRVWILTYPDRTTFYLTDEEREQFLRGLANDKTIIQIGSLTLTGRFTHMYQFKNKQVKKEYIDIGNNTLKEKSETT